MNDFPTLQERSLEEWQVLQTSPDPVIYIGMGSCGLASGAGDVWDLTKDILDQQKSEDQCSEGGMYRSLLPGTIHGHTKARNAPG